MAAPNLQVCPADSTPGPTDIPRETQEQNPLHGRIFERLSSAPAPSQRPDRTTLKVLFGFSGPAGRTDGFAAWAMKVADMLGYSCEVVEADIENGLDLAEQTEWDKVIRDNKAHDGYHASLWSPPCSTFSGG